MALAGRHVLAIIFSVGRSRVSAANILADSDLTGNRTNKVLFPRELLHFKESDQPPEIYRNHPDIFHGGCCTHRFESEYDPRHCSIVIARRCVYGGCTVVISVYSRFCRVF